MDNWDYCRVCAEICIPEAVWQEVVVAGSGLPGAKDVETASWITRCTVSNSTLVMALRQYLDTGKAEAIALALEFQAELLVMNENLGRETARHLGQRFIGIIGVLIEASSVRLNLIWMRYATRLASV